MTPTPSLEIYLAQPRGFCAGVQRAIEIVDRALAKFGPPVYVRHEIVHNKRVVNDLTGKGAIFVESLDQIPDGAITVLSAHGAPQAVTEKAKSRGLPVFDATCPLVTKVHLEGRYHASQGREVILIGNKGHPEVIGTDGQIPGGVLLVTTVSDVAKLAVKDPEALAYVTQTTLSVDDTQDVIDALRKCFPAIQGPDLKHICYATQNRQSAGRSLALKCDMVLVVGSQNSSNSKRLREIAESSGVPAYLVDDTADIDPDWLVGIDRLGVTAGASAPEELVSEVIEHLKTLRPSTVTNLEGVEEKTFFKLPRELDDAPATSR